MCVDPIYAIYAILSEGDERKISKLQKMITYFGEDAGYSAEEIAKHAKELNKRLQEHEIKTNLKPDKIREAIVHNVLRDFYCGKSSIPDFPYENPLDYLDAILETDLRRHFCYTTC
jgi:hypothetical protein